VIGGMHQAGKSINGVWDLSTPGRRNLEETMKIGCGDEGSDKGKIWNTQSGV